MGQVAQQLGRALRAGTTNGRAVRIPAHRRTADRTVIRDMIGLCSLRTLFRHDRDDLRNNFPRLLDNNGVTDANIFFRNKVLIVQCGICDCCARQTHRRQVCFGGQHTGAAHLNDDILHHSGLLLRRILIGRRPAGKFGRTAELCPGS